jgi:transposase
LTKSQEFEGAFYVHAEPDANEEIARESRAGVDGESLDSFMATEDDTPSTRRRRRFPAEYKLRILREADACREPGEIGALLRREGIYSSHLALWRRQREEAAETQLSARKRGPKPRQNDPRVRILERENARLHRKVDQLERMRREAARILAVRNRSPDADRED